MKNAVGYRFFEFIEAHRKNFYLHDTEDFCHNELSFSSEYLMKHISRSGLRYTHETFYQ